MDFSIALQETASTQTITQAAAEREYENICRFREVMKELESQMETKEQKAQRQKAEKQERQDKADKTKKINELYSLIAKLRGMLYRNGEMDTSILAQISAAETQLFWLLFSF